MADDKDLNKDKAREYLKSILDTKDSMQELYALNRAYNISLGKTDDYAKSINRQFGTQRALATEALKASRERLRTEGDRVSLAKISNNIEETANDMLRARAQTQADLLLKQVMIKESLIDEYAEQAKNYKLLLDKNVITEDSYKKHLKELKAEQDSVKHLKEHVEMSEAIANQLHEIVEESEAWKHSLTKAFETAKAIGRDPKVFGAFMLTQMAEKIEHVNHAMHELVDTGMQAGEAINLMRQDFSLMSAMGLSKVNDVSKALVTNFGSAKALTEEQRAAVGEMAYNYGLAGDEATNLMMAVAQMPGQSMDTAKNFKNTAESVGKMKGVLPSQIMKEMAKNTQNIAVYSKGGAEGFAKAAASAKRMGLEIQNVLTAAEKTLEYESSISDQMEASVLLGKQINMDKLRQAALSGDANAIMREQTAIMRQVGNFDNMNLLQKRALEKALGMTTEEMKKFNAEIQFNEKYFGATAGPMDNFIGKTLKYGGAAANFAKENGMMILTLVQATAQLGTYAALTAAKTAAQTADTASLTANTTATRLNAVQTQAYNAMRAASIPATQALAAARAMDTANTNINTGSENLNTASKQRGILATILMNGVNLVRNGILAAGNVIMSAATGIMSLFSVSTVATGTAAGFAAVPMLALGAAVLMVGTGIGLAAYGISFLVQQLGAMPFENLAMLPLAFMGMAAGLVAMAGAGVLALPTIQALAALGAVAVGLGAIGAIVSETSGGEGKAKEEDRDTKEVLKKLMTYLENPRAGAVYLDKQKVGEIVFSGLNYGKVGIGIKKDY